MVVIADHSFIIHSFILNTLNVIVIVFRLHCDYKLFRNHRTTVHEYPCDNEFALARARICAQVWQIQSSPYPNTCFVQSCVCLQHEMNDKHECEWVLQMLCIWNTQLFPLKWASINTKNKLHAMNEQIYNHHAFAVDAK